MNVELLAHAVKQDPALRDTNLILLTSSLRPADRSGFQQAGFSAHLLKPVCPSVLLDTLAAVWAGRLNGKVKTEAMPRHEMAEPAAGAPLEAAVLSTRCRALVAEDNVVNQKVAARFLERFGCRVDIAASGKEAVEMAGKFPYDVVFVDFQMPEMDGYEATALIRKREAAAGWRTPIIAMTANAMQGDREKCLAAGMDDYISKPVQRENLLRLLEQWLRLGSNEPAPPQADPPHGAEMNKPVPAA